MRTDCLRLSSSELIKGAYQTVLAEDMGTENAFISRLTIVIESALMAHPTHVSNGVKRRISTAAV